MLVTMLIFILLAVQPPSNLNEITIHITPQRVPVPAFQNVLLPPLSDKTTGNAVQSYYRCLAPDSLAWFLRDKTSERSYAWCDLPYSEASKKGKQPASALKKKDDEEEENIPAATRDELSYLLQLKVLDEIDFAARRTYAEWEYLEKLKQSGYFLLLPELQGIRILSTLLQIRARLQLMEGNYARSLYHLQSGMALARHLDESRLIMGTLTGNGIARNMNKVLFEWVQQPGSPNLYWAFADLPKPFFDLRKAYEGDRLAVRNMMADFTLLNERILTKDEVRKMLEEKLKITMRMFGNTQETGLTMLIAREYPRAKVWLKQQGWSQEKIEQMTATQAVLLFAYSQQQNYADEFQKIFTLPPMEQLKLSEKLNKQLANRTDEMATYLVIAAYPGYSNILLSIYDLEREFVVLRCIEVLRHYAAGHEKNLPTSWADITDLPIPSDPITGEALKYELKADHAVITLPAINIERARRSARVFKVYVHQGK